MDWDLCRHQGWLEVTLVYMWLCGVPSKGDIIQHRISKIIEKHS